MDALQMLKKDHQTVNTLFQRFEKLGEKAGARKAQIARKICDELTLHAELEEQVFYPTIREADEDMILESFEEHAIVKNLIEQIRGMSPDEETFDAKVSVMKELVQHHVKEEEKELFKNVRKMMSKGDLEALGKEMAKAKRTYKKMLTETGIERGEREAA